MNAPLPRLVVVAPVLAEHLAREQRRMAVALVGTAPRKRPPLDAGAIALLAAIGFFLASLLLNVAFA